MKFSVDHDLHIHSQLSSCSRHPEQTPARILRYAQEENLKTVSLTDHFWDETIAGASPWYEKQNYPHICAAKPLPQDSNIRFLFGCETELNQFLTLGISRERMEQLDFIIIPTTHFHMKFALSETDRATVESRAKTWVERLDSVLNMDLPFHKIGIAHLTCPLIGTDRETYLQILNTIPSEEMYRVFQTAAKRGVGIELNAQDMKFQPEEKDTVLRPYCIAKECGCKFYCGSDAHEPQELEEAKAYFEKAVDLLNLKEDDKFVPRS